MAGARELCEQGVAFGTTAVIGEPTGLVPVHKHKGVAMVRVVVDGRAGHSSDPAAGLSAIDGMHQVLAALNAWRVRLGQTYRDADFRVPEPTVNFGRLSGGDSPNRICGRCELDVDLRLLPSMDRDAVLTDLREVVVASVQPGGYGVEVQTLSDGVAAYEIGPDKPVVQVAEQLSGHRCQAALFGTEAPYLAALGMQTVILGAGDIAVAHQPNEFVRIDAIRRATALYAKLVDRFCVQEPRST